MSKDMISTFRRSGQFILMDATCKTNRFGMPLVLLAGVNEIKITVILALALIQVEDGESYLWVLQQVQKAIGTVLIYTFHLTLHRHVCHTYGIRIPQVYHMYIIRMTDVYDTYVIRMSHVYHTYVTRMSYADNTYDVRIYNVCYMYSSR